MKYNPKIHNRKSQRIQGHDYSLSGLYFITFCCQDRVCHFGHIKDNQMILNSSGLIANEFLENIPARFPQTRLHAYVVMPNHVHFIIEIIKGAIHESPRQKINDDKLIHESPQDHYRNQRRQMMLSKIIGWYKMNTAKQINIIDSNRNIKFWQRNYYERIIRDKRAYHFISKYIKNNPAKWKGK